MSVRQQRKRHRNRIEWNFVIEKEPLWKEWPDELSERGHIYCETEEWEEFERQTWKSPKFWERAHCDVKLHGWHHSRHGHRRGYKPERLECEVREKPVNRQVSRFWLGKTSDATLGNSLNNSEHAQRSGQSRSMMEVPLQDNSFSGRIENRRVWEECASPDAVTLGWDTDRKGAEAVNQ